LGKFLARFTIILLIFVTALSFVGCSSNNNSSNNGNNGNGGNIGNPTGPRGVWKIKEIKYGDTTKKNEVYPISRNLAEIGFGNGELVQHLYYSFDAQGHREYERYTDYHSVDVKFPFKEGVYYYSVISDGCNIQGNTVSYSTEIGNAGIGTVTLKFNITGKQAEIVRTSDFNPYEDRILAEWVGFSVKAEPRPEMGSGDPEDPGNENDLGFWRVKEIQGTDPWKPSTPIADLSEKEGCTGKVYQDLYWGFINGEFKQYFKFRFKGVDSNGKKLLEQKGIEDNKTYFRLTGKYTVEGNKVSYKL